MNGLNESSAFINPLGVLVPLQKNAMIGGALSGALISEDAITAGAIQLQQSSSSSTIVM
jgi:hypothetical protein